MTQPGYFRALLVGLVLVAAAAAVAVAWDETDETPAEPEAALLAKADTIAKKVAKLRGLAIKQTIDRGVMNKAEIRKRILERMDQEYSAEELAAEELAMKRMGLLPANTNYKKLVIDLLTDEIAGFYDPWEQRLYIAGWQTGMLGMGDGVMAHEIDHALQDQHFNLRKFMKAVEDNGDASGARQALVEGDGMALMVEFMMPPGVSPWSDPRVLKMMNGNVAGGGSPTLAAAPLILREGLVFPYTAGLEFVAHFRRHHSWKQIDKIYKKPPLATEHILHPSKYETYERPDEITAAVPAALTGAVSIYDNISGELGLSIFLRQHGIVASKAAIAAEGWGGDKTALFGNKAHGGAVAGTTGVIYTVWDHPADAMEFFDAMVDAMPQLSKGTQVTSGETAVVYRAGDEVFAAERKGDSVVVVVGAPAASADKVREQVWTWKVKRR